LKRGEPSSKLKYNIITDSVKYCEGMFKEGPQARIERVLNLDMK